MARGGKREGAGRPAGSARHLKVEHYIGRNQINAAINVTIAVAKIPTTDQSMMRD